MMTQVEMTYGSVDRIFLRCARASEIIRGGTMILESFNAFEKKKISNLNY